MIRRGDVVTVPGEASVYSVWAIEGSFAWLRLDVGWVSPLLAVEAEACCRVVNVFVDWVGWEVN